MLRRLRRRIRYLRRLQAARVAAFRHAPHCPRAPVYIPLWAVAPASTSPAARVMVHHPSEPCRVCGTAVLYSTRANRPKKYFDGRPLHVYCSAEHKAAAAAPPPAPRKPPPPPTPGHCPRPDKRAFDTEEEARTYFHTLLAADGQLDVYQCRCWKWHAGHGIDDALRIAAIARITTLKEKK